MPVFLEWPYVVLPSMGPLCVVALLEFLNKRGRLSGTMGEIYREKGEVWALLSIIWLLGWCVMILWSVWNSTPTCFPTVFEYFGERTVIPCSIQEQEALVTEHRQGLLEDLKGEALLTLGTTLLSMLLVHLYRKGKRRN